MKLNRKKLLTGLVGAAAILATTSASAFWGNWGSSPWNWGGWGNNWGGSPWGWGGGYPGGWGGGYPGYGWGGGYPGYGWGGGYPYYGGGSPYYGGYGYGYAPSYTYPSTTAKKPAAKKDKK